jgi:hypothetical protein
MWAQAKKAPIWNHQKNEKDEPLANIGTDIYSAVFPHLMVPLSVFSSLLPKLWILVQHNQPIPFFIRSKQL